jgi:hypothetical protein
MKNLTLKLLIGLICLFSSQLFAQEPTKLPKPLGLIEKFSDKLALNDTQKQQIDALSAKYQAIFAEKRASLTQMNRMEKWEMFKNLRNEIQTELKTILSPSQWEQFTQLRDEQKAAFKQKIKDFRQNGGKEKLKAMHEEIKAYRQKNIQPTMQNLRNQLENQLTEPDRQTIAQLREEREKLQKIGKELRENHRQSFKNRTALTEAQKQEMQKLREQIQTNRQKTKELAVKYQVQLEQLSQQIKSEKKLWEQDLKNIVQKHLPDNELFTKMNSKLGGKYRHEMSRTHFLLMEAKTAETSKNETNIFPNPASSQSTIEFKVKKEGLVKIELLDKDGNYLKTILNQNFGGGKHQYQINTQDLPNAVYYYKVSIGNRSDIKRLIIQK